MKKISIQFHATNKELADFANNIKDEFDLFAIVLRVGLRNVMQIENDISEINLMTEGTTDAHLVFSNSEFDFTLTSFNGFTDKNPGMIELHVGQLRDKKLEESWLAFMSDDPLKIELAKKVATRLKKITKASPIAANDIDDEETIDRKHRYSQGAKQMYEAGVRLQSISPSFFFKIV